MISELFRSAQHPLVSIILAVVCVSSPARADNSHRADQPEGTQKKESVLSDGEINSAVSDKLFFDRYFSPEQMKIQTRSGVVTLTGYVNDLRSEDRAVRIAEGIRGVRSVVNRLSVQPVKRSDAEIRQDIVSALLTDPTTDSYKIKVSVRQGVAEVSGKVQSWTEKNLAAWVAKGIPGIKEIKNNIEVIYNAIRPNHEIFQDITARIKRDPWLYQNQIKVNVDRGKVKLSGQVGGPAAKRRAHELAWVGGVKNVSLDALKVNPALKQDLLRTDEPALTKSDQEIKEAIRAALLWDPRVNLFNPKVEVKNGIVTLSGSVDSLIAKQAVEQNALNTVGVTSVVNNLKADVQKRDDAQVAKDVKASLAWNLPMSIRDQVEVKVKEGVVTATGKVNTPYQKWQVTDAATRVNGVLVVNNQVKLNSKTGSSSDKDLKQRIEAALLWDPVIESTDDLVKVSVSGGVAKLSGSVDTWDEHWAATYEAFEAGAIRVENSLNIEEAGIAGKTYTYSTFPVILTNNYWVG